MNFLLFNTIYSVKQKNIIKNYFHFYIIFLLSLSLHIFSYQVHAATIQKFDSINSGGTKRFFDPNAHNSSKNPENTEDSNPDNNTTVIHEDENNEVYDSNIDFESISINKQKLIKQLLNNDSKDLNWPPLPRSWMERSIIQQKNLSKNVGIQFNPFKIGLRLKRSTNNSYSLKTSLVIASSSIPVFKGKKGETSSDQHTKDFNYRSLLLQNEKDHQIYPNVDEHYPMIGFCSFEAKYVIETTDSTQISFLSSEVSSDDTTSQPVVYLFTSKLFQINKDISINKYLNNICGEIFKDQIQEKVLIDFQKLKNEVDFNEDLAELNKKTGDCETNSQLGKMTLEDSDDSCIEWKKFNFNEVIQNRTVARCVYNKLIDKNKCVLRAKENMTCPIYWDTQKKLYTKTYKYPKTISATEGYYEFPCDEASGYTCSFLSEPKLLLNTPLILGKGICVQKENMSQNDHIL